ncbi:MAG: replicative DNA helicase [Cardiobacteriaceae bacterium]|nr:replicative DNA helicase [Cardiobacteriaceae bacterium]
MEGFEDLARIKEPPKSKEAEQAVLGGVLLDNSRFDQISNRVYAQDFYFDNHRVIFEVMSNLSRNGKMIDTLTITEALRQRGDLEQIGGKPYLDQLYVETASAVNIGAYADIVHERAVMRRLISASSEIADSVYFPEGRDARELLDNAERKVFAIAESYQNEEEEGFKKVNEVTAGLIRHLEELAKTGSEITGLSTGWDRLDKQTAGLQPGDLIIVAGRPSMGKTTFAMNMAEYVAIAERKPVAVFSLEMPARSLVLRMISSLGRLDQSKLRLGQIEEEDEAKLMSAVAQLSKAPIYIHDGSNMSPTDIHSWMRRLAKQPEVQQMGGIGLILIDYLQLMAIPGFKEGKVNMMSEISRSLKLLAKEFNVPVIALSQLNRGVDSRPDHRPVMSDIRDSGAIEQDADVIMFVYRDEVYKKDASDMKGKAEIIIAKQRNGPTGTVVLGFQGQFLRFVNLAPQHYEDYGE